MTVDRLTVRLTADEVYAVAEVLLRVTPRQLRRLGLAPDELEAVDRAVEVLSEALQRDADRDALDPRQLFLVLPGTGAGGAR